MADWIPCSERLPSLGERVLVWSPWTEAIASLEKDENGVMCWECDDDEVASLRPPTHWQPLPPPPQV